MHVFCIYLYICIHSLHELTACIYYKLAIDRGLRGCDPDGEHILHLEHAKSIIQNTKPSASHTPHQPPNLPKPLQSHATSNNNNSSTGQQQPDNGFERSLSLLNDLNEAIRLAPLALQAVYEESPLECQRLATSQGWCTILCCTESAPEQPAYSLFATDHSSHTDNTTDNKQTHTATIANTTTDNTHPTHTTDTKVNSNSSGNSNSSVSKKKKEAVLAIRGTSSVQDIVTDIRSAPHKFPPRCVYIGSIFTPILSLIYPIFLTHLLIYIYT